MANDNENREFIQRAARFVNRDAAMFHIKATTNPETLEEYKYAIMSPDSFVSKAMNKLREEEAMEEDFWAYKAIKMQQALTLEECKKKQSELLDQLLAVLNEERIKFLNNAPSSTTIDLSGEKHTLDDLNAARERYRQEIALLEARLKELEETQKYIYDEMTKTNEIISTVSSNLVDSILSSAQEQEQEFWEEMNIDANDFQEKLSSGIDYNDFIDASVGNLTAANGTTWASNYLEIKNDPNQKNIRSEDEIKQIKQSYKTWQQELFLTTLLSFANKAYGPNFTQVESLVNPEGLFYQFVKRNFKESSSQLSEALLKRIVLECLYNVTINDKKKVTAVLVETRNNQANVQSMLAMIVNKP